MCESGAAHFKAFSLPYLRRESCGERLRVPLLKQTRRLSITPHSSQSQSCLFKSSFSCCAFILHRGLFRSIPPSAPLYYHGYCHKSTGQSERHGTHTHNFKATESAAYFCDVRGAELFHMQMIKTK